MAIYISLLFIFGISIVSITLSFLLYKLKPFLIFLPSIFLIGGIVWAYIMPKLNDYGLGSIAFILFFIFFTTSLIFNLAFSIVYYIKQRQNNTMSSD